MTITPKPSTTAETSQDVARTHPLEPLSASEIEQASAILRTRQQLPETYRFVSITLAEPGKQEISHASTHEVPRHAFVVLLDRATGHTHEARVSLSDATVLSWREVSGVQAPVMRDEIDEAEKGIKRDDRFVDALAKRGVHRLDLVCVEPWSAGHYGEDYEGRRVIRALVYVRNFDRDNPYAHPVDDLIVVYDLNAGAVLWLEDGGPVHLPTQNGNYTAADVESTRDDLEDLRITQPDGPSFTVDGHHIRWQNWDLRIGFTPREGVVLHQVGIRGNGGRRSVLHRAALSEMVVPYGDPSPVQARKNAFDAGEYNIGALTNSLRLGCDCLGEIHYFDAALNDSMGNAMTIRNAICVHEEDAGLLWKHTDFRRDEAEVRRSRRLVISFIATVANYEYAFYWNLYQDGTIECVVKMTGIVSTAVHSNASGTPDYGQRLNLDGLYAPIHQHVFNVRLDMDVDGARNSVYEVEIEPVPQGPGNPMGNAFRAVERLLTSERQAQRDAAPGSQRHWKIVNNDVRNAVGEPTAYRLMPSNTATLFAAPDASVYHRANFATRTLWVTPYASDERHAAGDYPNQHAGGAGLPEWTENDRPLADEDVVLWHTFGSNHSVRLEDWPVMPVQHAGFTLQPVGFFDQNPTLDLPPSSEQCH